MSNQVRNRVIVSTLATMLILAGIIVLSRFNAGVAPAQAQSEGKPVALDGTLEAKTLFTATNPIIALAADKQDNVYAVVYKTGEILKINPDGKSTPIYTGLKSCGFGAFAALAVLPDGSLAAYDCSDKKSIVVKIDPSGNKNTLATFDDDNLMSMTADSQGQIYLGLWTSGKAKLTVQTNPTRLTAAEKITGYVARLEPDGKPTSLYEGGIPVSLTAADDGSVWAATWGKSGPFRAASKKYSTCNGTTVFWIVLSEQVAITRLVNGKPDSTSITQLNAVSSIAAGKNGLVFAAGKGKTESGNCGVYYMPLGQAPKQLSFSQKGVDVDITALAATANNLYLADVKGNISRVALVSK